MDKNTFIETLLKLIKDFKVSEYNLQVLNWETPDPGGQFERFMDFLECAKEDIPKNA